MAPVSGYTPHHMAVTVAEAGRRGGEARAKRLSAQERRRIAKLGSEAAQRKRKKRRKG